MFSETIANAVNLNGSCTANNVFQVICAFDSPKIADQYIEGISKRNTWSTERLSEILVIVRKKEYKMAELCSECKCALVWDEEAKEYRCNNDECLRNMSTEDVIVTKFVWTKNYSPFQHGIG
jgi:hypothetical protein